MGASGEGAIPSFEDAVSGQRLLDAADAAGIGVTVTLIEGPLAGRNVFVSQAAARIAGVTVQEMLDDNALLRIAPRDLPRMRERFERRLAGETLPVSYSVRVRRKDGSETVIDVSSSSVQVGGRPAVFTFIRDASQRVAAEEARLRSEVRFRELIEHAPEPIGILRGGCIAYANRACVEAFGYPNPQALYAIPLRELLDATEERSCGVSEPTTSADQVLEPVHTYRLRRFDGSLLLMEVSRVHFEYEGRPSVLAMGRDVTERRRLERQLVQADRLSALGTLAAGVAHEINNPLAYVLLNLEWIGRKLPGLVGGVPGSEAMMQMLEEARQGVERVSTIVRDLRSFSRAEGETRRPVDVPAVVRTAIKLASHEIRHRARIVTSFEEVPPVWANQARLEQVAVNLLLNAAQAMAKPQPNQNEIRVAVRRSPEGQVLLEVTDNGVGIPADILPRIFDPFFTTKPSGVGTGLGLSICHEIVASIGGRMTASSTVGQGTTFRVLLPTGEPTQAGKTPADDMRPSVTGAPPRGPDVDADRAPSGPRGSARPVPCKARVLVVDDELPIANTLRDLLYPAHEVVATTSAQEALGAIEADPDFDVVFCDMMMPGMSGIDLYERIRSERPGFERCFVFMTGGAFTPRTAEFLASVDNRSVEKPFSLDLVERIVHEAAVRRRAGDLAAH